MITETSKEAIFKHASSTYYYASLLFPKHIRDDVFTLYAFVRTADDLVDSVPQRKKEFFEFRKSVSDAFDGKVVEDKIISDFILLHKRKKFERSWTESFLDAMESDLSKPVYKTFSELEKYMYGSAEVIGLYMVSIMELPTSAHKTARLQGKAMQLINFVRDVSEDMKMGRQYIPLEDLKRFHLTSFTLTTNQENERFSNLMRFEIERYRDIQRQASEGYRYIQRRNRIPIQTAASLYEWTSERIYENPLIVFEKKVKPNKYEIIGMYFRRAISL